MGEVVAQLWAEPVEQVEESAGIASHQRSRQAEGLADDVGQHAGGDALGGAATFVLMYLVTYQQVEEAPHPVLHVVGQGVAPGAGAVRLPEGLPQRAQLRLRRRSSASVRGTPSLSVTWP